MSMLSQREACRRFRDELEANLYAGNREESPAHTRSCGQCAAAYSEWLTSRKLLSGLATGDVKPQPWFAKRVMVAIAAQEAELRRSFDPWSIVPRLAARFTWASAVALLLASTWLYTRPPAKVVATDITGEPVAAQSSNLSVDDVLASMSERLQ